MGMVAGGEDGELGRLDKDTKTVDKSFSAHHDSPFNLIRFHHNTLSTKMFSTKSLQGTPLAVGIASCAGCAFMLFVLQSGFTIHRDHQY